MVRAKLDVIDWVMAPAAALPAFALFGFPLVALRFGAMFADFGAASLPAATRLALVPWFSIGVGLAVCAAIALSMFARGAVLRRIALACIFVFGASTLAFCVVAMYLPMFELAGEIR